MISKLTTQEIKILSLIAVGLTNEEIADKLNISDKTVKTHRQSKKGSLFHG
jgi:DNA-binding NarL/FixJ family response regulator